MDLPLLADYVSHYQKTRPEFTEVPDGQLL